MIINKKPKRNCFQQSTSVATSASTYTDQKIITKEKEENWEIRFGNIQLIFLETTFMFSKTRLNPNVESPSPVAGIERNGGIRTT